MSVNDLPHHDELVVYGTGWCPDVRRSRALLVSGTRTPTSRRAELRPNWSVDYSRGNASFPHWYGPTGASWPSPPTTSFGRT